MTNNFHGIVAWQKAHEFVLMVYRETKNFPDFKQDKIAIATFGPSTAKAAKEAGLRLDIEAPSEKYPSMTGALQHYLLLQED